MSTFHAQQARKQSARAYEDAQRYCENADVRLSRDPVEGYWLHFDGRMRFVGHLSDVRGVVDWLEWQP